MVTVTMQLCNVGELGDRSHLGSENMRSLTLASFALRIASMSGDELEVVFD